MKKTVLWLTALAIVFLACGYGVYRWYVPKLVTQALLHPEEELPVFVPEKLKRTIKSIEAHAGKKSAVVISAIHDSGVTVEQLLATIDVVQEDQVYAALDELNSTEIENVDQAFDIVKKHIPVSEFDVEKLREPYRKLATMERIERGLKYANRARATYIDDPELAREIAKKLLVQKEKEFREKYGI
jgi:hypothetical protein